MDSLVCIHLKQLDLEGPKAHQVAKLTHREAKGHVVLSVSL